MLRRAVGEKVGFDLATGRLLAAREAEVKGLVSRVFPDDVFDDRVAEVLRVLCSISAGSLALTKQQFYRLDGTSFEEGVRLSANVNAVSRTTPDFRSAIAAFLKQ
jgi:enoyl-CoA hydratase